MTKHIFDTDVFLRSTEREKEFAVQHEVMHLVHALGLDPTVTISRMMIDALKTSFGPERCEFKDNDSDPEVPRELNPPSDAPCGRCPCCQAWEVIDYLEDVINLMETDAKLEAAWAAENRTDLEWVREADKRLARVENGGCCPYHDAGGYLDRSCGGDADAGAHSWSLWNIGPRSPTPKE